MAVCSHTNHLSLGGGTAQRLTNALYLHLKFFSTILALQVHPATVSGIIVDQHLFPAAWAMIPLPLHRWLFYHQNIAPISSSVGAGMGIAMARWIRSIL